MNKCSRPPAPPKVIAEKPGGLRNPDLNERKFTRSQRAVQKKCLGIAQTWAGHPGIVGESSQTNQGAVRAAKKNSSTGESFQAMTRAYKPTNL